MDREHEELQPLGFFGICKKSINIICEWSKIFIIVTLSLVLPFLIILQTKFQISKLLDAKIKHNEHTLDSTQEGTTTYDEISNLISSERTLKFLLKFAFGFFVVFLSCIPIIAVLNTVVAIFTGKEFISWKDSVKLFVTFLWCFAFAFAYHSITLFIFFVWEILYEGGDVGLIILYLMIVFYVLGLVYIVCIWLLATLVSVSADLYGIQAVIKSTALFTGKTGVYTVIWLCTLSSYSGIYYIFDKFVLDNGRIGIGAKVGYGALSTFLLVYVHLLSYVVQTVLLEHINVHLQRSSHS